MELSKAATIGDLDQVRKLIKSGVDVNEKDATECGFTPLNLATQRGFLDVVKCLVEEGKADLHVKDSKGSSCLFIAALENHLSLVKYLSERDCSLIDDPDEDGRTPLWQACAKGHLEVVDYLVIKGANVEKSRNDQITPLWIASQGGYLAIIKYLVGSSNANVNATDKFGRTPFLMAAGNNHVDVMEYLLQKGSNINETDEDNTSPLYTACERGYKETVEFLIRNGADPEIAFKGYTPLMRVCVDGREDLVKILHEQGQADLTKTIGNRTALDFAKAGNHHETVTYIESEFLLFKTVFIISYNGGYCVIFLPAAPAQVNVS